MFEIDSKTSAKLREKRGLKNLTIHQASEEIGISRRTLRDIENEKKSNVKKTVYTKLIAWLLSE